MQSKCGSPTIFYMCAEYAHSYVHYHIYELTCRINRITCLVLLLFWRSSSFFYIILKLHIHIANLYNMNLYYLGLLSNFLINVIQYVESANEQRYEYHNHTILTFRRVIGRMKITIICNSVIVPFVSIDIIKFSGLHENLQYIGTYLSFVHSLK